MRSPKGKGRNIFSSNSVVVMKYHPVGWPNENLHRLLKTGTFWENNSSKNILYIYLFVPMNFWDLGRKGYVSFDCAIRNNGVEIFDKTST